MVQSAKAGGCAGDAADLRAIAADVVNEMAPGVVYLLGPGTTTRAIAAALGVEKTLLGVDAVRDRRLIGADLSERADPRARRGGRARRCASWSP